MCQLNICEAWLGPEPQPEPQGREDFLWPPDPDCSAAEFAAAEQDLLHAGPAAAAVLPETAAAEAQVLRGWRQYVFLLDVWVYDMWFDIGLIK